MGRTEVSARWHDTIGTVHGIESKYKRLVCISRTRACARWLAQPSTAV
ncbi:GntR family transcriptional regulator [Burkholderia diffusa]|uniref:GntR family transcriptional regulator n=1 Tax=Burkholderia diffusa TaxID=488732 RepID=A0A6P2P8B9_9BURK|nr:GntR family transcriptional regulator [Burkholderia diffusa]